MSSIAFLLVTLATAVGVGALHFAAHQDRTVRSERYLITLDRRRRGALRWAKARSAVRTPSAATRPTVCANAG